MWEPILPTDWMRPVTAVLARLHDRRASQYWDADRTLAKALSDSSQPEPRCCRRKGILWDLAAVFPPGAKWEGSLPAATFFNGPVANVKDELESEVRKR